MPTRHYLHGTWSKQEEVIAEDDFVRWLGDQL